jgi:ABC-2 type transport system permease protein
MPPELGAGDRRAATTVALITLKRAVRSAAVWGGLFGLLVANEALTFHKNFPTSASREKFAQTLGTNTGIAAIIGPARHVDTIGGFVAWRVFGLLLIVGAIWGLLTATRLIRREEDAGRWELLLSGRTDRRHAAVQALAGLGAGWLVLWALTALLTAVAGTSSSVGFSVSASVFYATACTLGAAMFLAIGTLAGQLAPTRRQANGLGAAAFAVFYLIRMVADSGTGLAWLRWVSPLGWVENLRPLTGSDSVALIPIIGLGVLCAASSVILAGRRDLGAGVLSDRRSARSSVRLLGRAGLLVVQLERWVALAWIGGLAVLGLIFGVVARSAAAGNVAVATIEQQLGRLGAHPGSAVAAWIGYEYIFIAALLAFAAAGQIAALRGEEADGHLDNLLARRLDRVPWLAGRLAFAATFVLLAGLATGLGGWIGVAARNSQVGFSAMFQAGFNIAVPALLVLGLGVLLYGIVPRLAVPILYMLVLWSFLIEVIGSSITSNRWLLDTAVLTHLGPVPATALDWTAIAALIGISGIGGLIGLFTFRQRDLVPA